MNRNERLRSVFQAHGFKVGAVPFSSVANKPVDGAKTVLITYLPYYFPKQPNQNLARFACLPDYHQFFGAKLRALGEELHEIFPECDFQAFTDNSPIDERKAAVLSGIAAQGRNRLCITEEGSFLFFGELITNGDFSCPATPPKLNCDGCGRCIAACPGNALTQTDFHMERCVALITQKKGELAPWEQEILLACGSAWGCDRCAEVCPHNAPIAGKTAEIAQAPNQVRCHMESEMIRDLSDRAYRTLFSDRAFAWRGKATMLRNLMLLEENHHGKTEKN